MNTPANASDLSQEQQDTASLLDRLLGKAIADRYVDFCRLAAGAFLIKVSRPLAAHSLRELDSTLRHVLAVPMEAKAPESPENAAQIEVRKPLRAVASFTGAWIETINACAGAASSTVASFTGAWIETNQASGFM